MISSAVSVMTEILPESVMYTEKALCGKYTMQAPGVVMNCH